MNCDFCWHDEAHTSRKGCHHLILELECPVYCGCDGRTQRFRLEASTRAEVQGLSKLATAAGYALHEFTALGYFRVGPSTPKHDRCVIVAYSPTLAPVASYSEFLQRIGATPF